MAIHSTYYMNWAAFDVPGVSIVDRTTHVVGLAHPDHPDVGVVVCREEHPQGKTLREVVASRVAAEMTRLTGYSVIENVETEWGGAPAIEVISRWRHEGEIVYGRQAHFVDGDTWTMFSLSGPWASREACDGWLADIRASLRLRSDS